MKYLKLFEGQDNIKNYIIECLLDVSENPNFKVSDLSTIELSRSEYKSVYKLHIEKGESISLPQPGLSNIYIGFVKTDSEFLKMGLDKMFELLEDIEVALKRISDKFPESECNIYANRRDEISIDIFI